MTTAAGDPVPAVPESAAEGEIAEIFADIRATFGVAVVNLVWRHLATIPGALPWCWAAVRPAYREGSVPFQAAALRRALPLPAVPAPPAVVFDAIGIGPDDRAHIRRVLDSYDQTNAMALIALTALSLRLEGRVPAAESGGRARIPAIDGPMPRLLARSEMTPDAANLVARLDALGRRPDERIVASMYRHLSHWPAYLGLSLVQLAPLAADGRLAQAIEAAGLLARDGARRIAADLTPPDRPLDPAARAAARRGIEEFTRHPIARMVPIAALLRRLMPA
ncbi:hypothetical protein EDC65_5412 [Stella humosa]|uniref:Uncharacterized protein n=1 Tax=Stella humosa TaxID=94 RepID=A0A3N1KP06_9PROT|nr:hypothetical protein [Stella humosa]ROP81077.1 hypothetical protein EDC65_5412 [Stella humosa]BBK29767.1 hypothetical protein STHU_04010 [Stella humosa]